MFLNLKRTPVPPFLSPSWLHLWQFGPCYSLRYSHGMSILLPPVSSILTREPPLGNQSRGEMLTLHYGHAKKHIQRIKRIEYPCSHLQWDKSTLPVLQTPSPYPTCLSPGVPPPPREDHCLGFGLVLSLLHNLACIYDP